VDHIRASSQNGCTQRPDTWLHPNVSRIRQIPSCTAGAVQHRDEQVRLEFSVAIGGAADMDGRTAQLLRPTRMTQADIEPIEIPQCIEPDLILAKIGEPLIIGFARPRVM
jgi:hypothetical protein